MKAYLVIMEQAQKNWAAYSPDVPGCVATGKTADDARREFAKALRTHLSLLKERGQPLPQPSTQADFVGV